MASDVPLPLRAPAATAPDARRGAAIRAATVLALACVAWAVPHLLTLPSIPLCAFRLWTGLPCPGCGMTRAVFRMAHGDVATAFRFHPVAPVLAVFVAVVLAGALVGVATGRDPVWRAVTRRATEIVLAAIGVLVATWVVRAFVVPSWGPDAVVVSGAADPSAGGRAGR
jgi:hypothetical protein